MLLDQRMPQVCTARILPESVVQRGAIVGIRIDYGSDLRVGAVSIEPVGILFEVRGKV